MRGIFKRVALFLVALVVACVGAAASFAYFCYAIFAAYAIILSPPLAALATGSTILIVTAALVGIAVATARAPRRRESDTFTAGRALGSLFAEIFRAFAKEDSKASVLMSLISGFFAGAKR